MSGGILNDVLAAVLKDEKKTCFDGSKKSLNAMRIKELRRRAHEKGSEVDGTRELLVIALKSVE